MNIDSLIAELNSSAECNEALNLLTSIVVDTDPRLVESLSNIILTPEIIKDSNSFASLLKFLSEKDFIPALVKAISKAQYPSSLWLGDYLYALDSLLSDKEEILKADESFVHLLGNWLLNTEGGEISWKASYILAAIENPETKQYCIRGAFDQSLFHMTRIECIRGIINHHREEANDLLNKLANDSDENVRNAVADAQQFINSRTNKKT